MYLYLAYRTLITMEHRVIFINLQSLLSEPCVIYLQLFYVPEKPKHNDIIFLIKPIF